MTIEQMKKRKQELGLSNETIARMSGLPLSTVQKILGGVTKSPREKSLRALERVLFNSDFDNMYGIYPDLPYRMEQANTAHILREAAPAYHAEGTKDTSPGVSQPQGRYLSRAAMDEINYMRQLTHDPRQGTYTIADRDALPDDRHTELIDGIIYDMAAPSPRHQFILLRLSMLIQAQIDEENCGCAVYIAPTDVNLDKTEYTMVQPDLLILCKPTSFGRNWIIGAPDLIMEVLSPSTRRKDQRVKSRKYAENGVKEYWMIDPNSETITILYLNGPEDDGHTQFAAIYGFHDKIPVGICHNGFKLDFERISAAMATAREQKLLPEPGVPFRFGKPHQDENVPPETDPDEPA